jgi:alpha-galactosidase
LEGNGEKSEHQFVRTDETGTCYVYFNYTENPVQITIPLERIGGEVSQKTEALDLWNNQTIDLKAPVIVPGKDVLVVQL